VLPSAFCAGLSREPSHGNGAAGFVATDRRGNFN
jgi:hypothetical protein